MLRKFPLQKICLILHLFFKICQTAVQTSPETFRPKSSDCQSNIKFKNNFQKLNILSVLMFPCYSTKKIKSREGCGVPKNFVNVGDIAFQVIQPEKHFWEGFMVKIATEPESIGGDIRLPYWLGNSILLILLPNFIFRRFKRRHPQ